MNVRMNESLLVNNSSTSSIGPESHENNMMTDWPNNKGIRAPSIWSM